MIKDLDKFEMSALMIKLFECRIKCLELHLKQSQNITKLFLILILCFIRPNYSFTQIGSTSDFPVASEFSIPVSPAFDLIGVNNALVARPGNIRDFKVDWAFKSWRLRPNLALQAQPIWEVIYNRRTLEKYQKASLLMRTLSTIDLSAGTIEDDSQLRRLSFAAKITVYQQRDALLNAKLFEESAKSFDERRAPIEDSIHEIKKVLRFIKNSEKKDSLQSVLDAYRNQSDLLDIEQKRSNLEIASLYTKKFWNSSFVDVAFGRVFSYRNDTLLRLDLKGTGIAAWINASIGIGNKILITSMVRTVMVEDDLNGEKNVLWSGGLNFRYGSPKFNFFAEGVFTQTNNETIFANLNVNLIQANSLSTSYGGDWRISRNVMLSYGVRVDYSSTFKFQTISPIAGIACMMR
ncbi:MAG: hypothetical protein IPI50_12305 [Saprospiraceae bacterium]|nr:hypothetical protein [Saprospiraceae bacterium]